MPGNVPPEIPRPAEMLNFFTPVTQFILSTICELGFMNPVVFDRIIITNAQVVLILDQGKGDKKAIAEKVLAAAKLSPNFLRGSPGQITFKIPDQYKDFHLEIENARVPGDIDYNKFLRP